MQQDTNYEGIHIAEPKKKEWFYIVPFAYLICIYLAPLSLFIPFPETDFWNEVRMWIVGGMFLVVFFLGIGNIVTAVLHSKPQYRAKLFNAAILIRYGLIPFYIMGGIVIAFCFLLSFIPVPFMVFLGLPLAAFGSVVGWLIMAFGAPYAISYLRVTVKEKERPVLMAFLHSMLHFLFVWDVIDMMILSFRERRWQKLTIFIIVSALIAVIAFIVWLVLSFMK